MGPIVLNANAKHPIIACTPVELERLRRAWASASPAHEPVAKMIARAEAAMNEPLVFPPRGGQHNQWYQCEPCQTGLKTIDDTHHQCPKCKKIYTGEPYDDVIYEHKHQANLENAVAAAWAFAITREKRYAEFTRAVLIGYAQRYVHYPFHDAHRRNPPHKSGGRLSNQTLNESMMVSLKIAPAYDLIHDSDVLSADDHRAIRQDLLLPMLNGIDAHKAGKNNWQSWHNVAFVWGGAMLGDASWIDRAINDPEHGFRYQMEVSVLPEGMWYENSWGYHFYTLQALGETAEGMRRLGVDLWPHSALKKMVMLPGRYVMPDGQLPRFGDDVGIRANAAARQIELAYHAYRDEQLLRLLSAEPNWYSVLLGRDPQAKLAPAPMRSEIMPGAGHAILRSNGSAKIVAAMTFGPFGGFHGHFDKLSFVFYAHGRELGVDPGRAASQAYRLPIHANWYRATVSHNTVMVNGTSQKGVEATLESFAAGDSHAMVVAPCDNAYEGVQHRRLLCVTPTYAVVIDELRAEQETQFDWLYHNRATAVTTNVAMGGATVDAAFQGQEFLQNIRCGQVDRMFKVAFEGDEITTTLILDPQPGTMLFTGDGPGASVLDRVPLAIVRRSGRHVHFAAVLEPVRGDTEASVERVVLQKSDSGMILRIMRRGGQDRIELKPTNAEFIEEDRMILRASADAGF